MKHFKQKPTDEKKSHDALVTSHNVLQNKHQDILRSLSESTEKAEYESSKAESLKQSNDILESEIDRKKKLLADLDHDYKKMLDRNVNYQQTFDNLVANERERLKSSLPELNKMLDDLSDSIGSIKVEREDYLNRISSLAEEIHIKNQDISAMDKILSDGKIKINELERKVGLLNQNIAEKEDNFNMVEKGIIHLKSVKFDLEDLINNLNRNIAQNKEVLDIKAKEIKELTKKCEEKKSAFSDMEQTIIELGIRERKVRDFAVFLQKKAQQLGVNIKLD